jgi:hypothetical protein
MHRSAMEKEAFRAFYMSASGYFSLPRMAVRCGQVRIGGFNQGVVFPSIDWGRHLYRSSMTAVARIDVE